MKTILCLLSCSIMLHADTNWVKLFNGKDLSGWTPKITNHPLGENIYQTFRVEDGAIIVDYKNYPAFKGQYGHLYTNLSYSHYIFRCEYKFFGKKMEDAPSYTNLNSGVMIHCQAPTSLLLDQAFPISLEFQFLADEGKGKRATGNVCTPGTHIHYQGALTKAHIIESSAPTFALEEWVKMEIEVHGNDEIIHRVNGQEVLRYQKPILDPTCSISPAQVLLDAGAPLSLSSGHIALQAEGQPVMFRNIELKPIPEKE